MSLVPINPLKDVLTGSIWDKFKELIEPYALINAIIFIVLNLVLVLPAAGNPETDSFIGLFTNTATFDAGNLDVWSLVVGTILVFIFSYIINNLNTFFLDFASGEIYRNSPIIGKYLKTRQVKRYTKIEKNAKRDIVEGSSEQERFDRDKAAFQLAYEFPFHETELGLTGLGNILLNPASYIKHQYGVSMQLAWPFIQERLLDDNKKLKTVQGNWVSLQFFTSLSGLFILVAIEIILTGRLFVNQLLQIATLMIFFGICHYVALEKARQWGRGIRRIFDSHIKEVFTDLGMEALKDLTPASENFKSNWENVMGWLAYGPITVFDYRPQKTWYKADTPQEWPKLKHPEFLKVESLPRFSKEIMVSPKVDGAYVSIEYLFAITNLSTGENPLSGKDSYLIIQDDGMEPPDIVMGKLLKPKTNRTSIDFDETDVMGKLQHGKPPGLLFLMGEIPPGSSCVLKYSIVSRILAVKSTVLIEKIEHNKSQQTAQTFIDIFPKKTEGKSNIDLEVEILDDTKSTLNSIAELIPAPPDTKTTHEGERSSNQRSATWHLPLYSGKPEKIRIRMKG